jgi:hypothetical protein
LYTVDLPFEAPQFFVVLAIQLLNIFGPLIFCCFSHPTPFNLMPPQFLGVLAIQNLVYRTHYWFQLTMTDPNIDVLVDPTSLQTSIQSVANSLQVWTATLPFPGWIWTPDTLSRAPGSYPTIDIFAYVDPKYKGHKIYLDPELYPPSSDKGFTDLKKTLVL